MFFKQCLLKNGPRRMVSWLPALFAKVGRVLKLRLPEGPWDDGWIVDEVYSGMEEAALLDRSRDYLRTRKASDI